MSTKNYVTAHAAAEQKGENGYWEACQIAHEAVNEGGFSRKAFAKERGCSASHIGIQAKVWETWGVGDPGRRPTYTKAYTEVNGSPGGGVLTPGRIVRNVAGLPAAEKSKLVKDLLADEEVEVPPAAIAARASDPDVARAIARNDQSMEAVEEAGIDHRARNVKPFDEAQARRDAGQVKENMRRALDDEDLAIGALRQVPGMIAEAIYCKEEWGVEDVAAEQEVLARIDRMLAAYRADLTASLTDADRAFAEENRIKL